MTGLIILTFIPLIVAAGFLIRARGEQKARLAAERHERILQEQLAERTRAHAEWIAVLTHELRSPIAAILGYEELLEDGTFGQLDPRAADALRRIRVAAHQLRALADGLDRAASDPVPTELAGTRVTATDLLNGAVSALEFDAQARDVSFTITDSVLAFAAPPAEAQGAVLLALAAAVKASPGTTLRLGSMAEPAAIRIGGTRLDLVRDNPDNALAGHARAPLSGPGFRLALASHAARHAGGSLQLIDDTDGSAILVLLPV